VTSKDGIKTVI